MAIKLLALDLDGTLFGDDLVISPRTLGAINAAQAAGVIVTIATGRMFRAARMIAATLNIEAPLLCYQGALARHSVTGEVLYHQTIPLPLAHEVISAVIADGLHLNVYIDEKLYVDQMNRHALFYA